MGPKMPYRLAGTRILVQYRYLIDREAGRFARPAFRGGKTSPHHSAAHLAPAEGVWLFRAGGRVFFFQDSTKSY